MSEDFGINPALRLETGLPVFSVFGNLVAMNRSAITSLFAIPPSLLGTESASYAISEEQLDSFRKSLVLPMLTMRIELALAELRSTQEMLRPAYIRCIQCGKQRHARHRKRCVKCKRKADRIARRRK